MCNKCGGHKETSIPWGPLAVAGALALGAFALYKATHPSQPRR